MAITPNAGNYLNGYLYGIDIPFTEIIAEFNLGFPFIGGFDSTGAYLFSFPTPSTRGVPYSVFEAARRECFRRPRLRA